MACDPSYRSIFMASIYKGPASLAALQAGSHRQAGERGGADGNGAD